MTSSSAPTHYINTAVTPITKIKEKVQKEWTLRKAGGEKRSVHMIVKILFRPPQNINDKSERDNTREKML